VYPLFPKEIFNEGSPETGEDGVTYYSYKDTITERQMERKEEILSQKEAIAYSISLRTVFRRSSLSLRAL
jgi:hypothetical protein